MPIKDAEDEFIGAREILGRRNFLISVEQTDRQTENYRNEREH